MSFHLDLDVALSGMQQLAVLPRMDMDRGVGTRRIESFAEPNGG